MNSTISNPFIQSELDYRRDRLRRGTVVRRRHPRAAFRRRAGRTDTNR
jgi:hypothetical protein